MVRLKDGIELSGLNEKYNFNSKMVRLKVGLQFFAMGRMDNFNSKMVRLKVRSVSGADLQSEKFQFQNGTIKRKVRRLINLKI